eukprot:GHRQ01006737.1.p2 GENE.GHRQ01006737.1~~GHRQ01006737.1.p2  ORF type:complete len:102 (-),score=25.91 GHRQ01006737.1:607-912(-)
MFERQMVSGSRCNNPWKTVYGCSADTQYICNLQAGTTQYRSAAGLAAARSACWHHVISSICHGSMTPSHNSKGGQALPYMLLAVALLPDPVCAGGGCCCWL